MEPIPVYYYNELKLVRISIKESEYYDFLWQYILLNLPSNSVLKFHLATCIKTYHYDGKVFKINDTVYTPQEFIDCVQPANEIVIYNKNITLMINVGFKFKAVKIIGYLQSVPKNAKCQNKIDNLFSEKCN